MPARKPFNFQEFVSDVVHVDGSPEIISRYGFKKIELNGKLYLTAMTRKEAVKVLSEILEVSEEKALAVLSKTEGCSGGGSSAQCYPLGGCKRCKAEGTTQGWLCYCIAD